MHHIVSRHTTRHHITLIMSWLLGDRGACDGKALQRRQRRTAQQCKLIIARLPKPAHRSEADRQAKIDSQTDAAI